ncbi:hypothetical protein TCON_1465 [Astathelohania contejeani]|uniref:Uncharacterized protein n=1 Tax=Astathelohania contejeani TaxID=164912 RepID=A0ABQ7HYU6_9MICR|nr:hypothetical protein TCON_1465 [Thelohania contejeani]
MKLIKIGDYLLKNGVYKFTFSYYTIKTINKTYIYKYPNILINEIPPFIKSNLRIIDKNILVYENKVGFYLKENYFIGDRNIYYVCGNRLSEYELVMGSRNIPLELICNQHLILNNGEKYTHYNKTGEIIFKFKDIIVYKGIAKVWRPIEIWEKGRVLCITGMEKNYVICDEYIVEGEHECSKLCVVLGLIGVNIFSDLSFTVDEIESIILDMYLGGVSVTDHLKYILNQIKGEMAEELACRLYRKMDDSGRKILADIFDYDIVENPENIKIIVVYFPEMTGKLVRNAIKYEQWYIIGELVMYMLKVGDDSRLSMLKKELELNECFYFLKMMGSVRCEDEEMIREIVNMKIERRKMRGFTLSECGEFESWDVNK